MIQGPFAAQDGNAGVPQNSREILINMYAESGQSGRSQLIRRQRPGLALVREQYGVKRGIEQFTHGHYLVIRNIAYKFDGSTLTQLGFLNTNIGPVTIITDDNDNVLFSDGVEAYHYAASTATWTIVVTPTDVGTLATQGGFGIYAVPGTGQFQVSALNDLTSWDALDFATAEGSPDPIVRVFVDHNEIWFLGSTTIEVWRNIGAQDFPFAPNTQLERGCLAPFSVAAEDNTIFWLGDDKIVYRADGYRPQRISTHAIEEWISDAPDPTAGRAFIFTERGHKFYVLTFDGYGTRFFDIATNLWPGMLRTWQKTDWEVRGGAGKPVHYYLTPHGIVTMDRTANTDVGEIMQRGGISAPVFNGGELMTFSAFWLLAEVGRVAEGQLEPQVMMRISRNGEDFGVIRHRGLGLTGDYKRRAIWRNMGQAREFVVEVSCTDDVPFAIIDTYGELA
jgi:hypothetical protein